MNAEGKDPRVFVAHILERIAAIEEFTNGMALETFLEDTRTHEAVIRQLEVIGEAVRNLPAEFRDAHPDIPWKDIAGMRDKLIHDYLGVDLAIVWQVVQLELPELKAKLRRLQTQTMK